MRSKMAFMTSRIAVVLLGAALSGCIPVMAGPGGQPGGLPLTEADVAAGLKEALQIGAAKAVELVSKPNGFLGDAAIKIPFPPELKKVEDQLRGFGLGPVVDAFVEKMNHGAEEAAKAATDIFVKAITEMTVEDAMKILKGADDAATQYFRGKTEKVLLERFGPPVRQALDTIGAAKAWHELASRYNQIPFVDKIPGDIVDYATKRALDGLFAKLALEEQKIRKEVTARTTDLLKRVFGSLGI